MAVMMGSSDGVWQLAHGQMRRAGLAHRHVNHVTRRAHTTLATVPHEGLYVLTASGDRLLWQGDARACAIGPDGTYYVGTELAMSFRSHDGGKIWQRADRMDTLPSRSAWYVPPPPHEPHVRSIDFLPGRSSSVLVGIEVGGVLLSADGGDTWEELNHGLDVDVHAMRPDPSQPGHLVAVTGRGCYASEDGGATWEQRMQGIDQCYTVGLHVNPARAGALLVTAGDGAPGVNGGIYHSRNTGRQWQAVAHAGLPDRYARVPVVFFTDGAAWVTTHEGQISRAEDVQGEWSLRGELPATIHAWRPLAAPPRSTPGTGARWLGRRHPARGTHGRRRRCAVHSVP